MPPEMCAEGVRNMKQRGTVNLFIVIAMLLAVVPMLSLAVDFGRVQVTRTDLQHAVDAAARAGAKELERDLGQQLKSHIEYVAKSVATSNMALSASVGGAGSTQISGSEITVQVGRWNVQTKTFTANGTPTNAVKVIASRNIGLVFGKFIKKNSHTVTASAVALFGKYDGEVELPPQCNPWLAGMPPGTTANSYDSAGNPTNPNQQLQSPIYVRGLDLIPGNYITFGPVTGGVLNYPDANALKNQDPDGNPNSDIYDHVSPSDSWDGSEHGMSDLKCPINALVGVFLSDEQPDKSPAPEPLDYTSASSRSKTTYYPKLKQPFFIGDGLTGRGTGTVQKFQIPQGATRLFLGTMDGYEWSNNVGAMSVKIPGAKSGVTLVE
jgi:Flp pilus assembly protein TadG